MITEKNNLNIAYKSMNKLNKFIKLGKEKTGKNRAM